MSIPLILASKSKPRRDVLYSAGVCPTIRVSHVDEPAALERAAAEAGMAVADLPIERRVTILATAKAQAVHEAYRQVIATAAAATGERIIGYPLRATSDSSTAFATAHSGRNDNKDAVGDASSNSVSASETSSPVISSEAKRSREIFLDYSRAPVATTRDFSGVRIPTTSEPISTPLPGQSSLAQAAVGPLILGCDSMFLLDGECYGKPHSEAVARERLRHMRGATGELWTGHCLIDLASGRVVSGASRAVVHFSEYSDADIERYIATGEPLEVAGSFTLEGFGGAFIDGIEGDPHGVIGLSLPLVRRLASELGIAWPDLWNVGRGVPESESKASGAAHAGIQPPSDNVHQPGDGWIDCACGRKHWGVNGASGVLLARRDEATGAVTHVVMQHRAIWSAEGGTWGIPGGATADGESPIEGALRESYEEANITPEDIEVVGSYREDHGNWAYTTVFAFERPGRRVTPRANDDESLEIEWVPIDEVPNRKLLTAMKSDWDMFCSRLDSLASTVSF